MLLGYEIDEDPVTRGLVPILSELSNHRQGTIKRFFSFH
jgi:hypothetical protein